MTDEYSHPKNMVPANQGGYVPDEIDIATVEILKKCVHKCPEYIEKYGRGFEVYNGATGDDIGHGKDVLWYCILLDAAIDAGIMSSDPQSPHEGVAYVFKNNPDVYRRAKRWAVHCMTGAIN